MFSQIGDVSNWMALHQTDIFFLNIFYSSFLLPVRCAHYFVFLWIIFTYPEMRALNACGIYPVCTVCAWGLYVPVLLTVGMAFLSNLTHVPISTFICRARKNALPACDHQHTQRKTRLFNLWPLDGAHHHLSHMPLIKSMCAIQCQSVIQIHCILINRLMYSL